MAGDDFFYIIGKILGAVDSSFDYDQVVGRSYSSDDGGRKVYTEIRHNDKGETNVNQRVETPYERWNSSVGWENTRDLRNMNDPYDQRGVGGFFW